ncbi:hypothetical protein F4819DRAFT_220938 [Hypoxylon fuscum]|nr:hypothetical protein F4819DRAFT_220938 [Hypoxylon fuscum]
MGILGTRNGKWDSCRHPLCSLTGTHGIPPLLFLGSAAFGWCIDTQPWDGESRHFHLFFLASLLFSLFVTVPRLFVHHPSWSKCLIASSGMRPSLSGWTHLNVFGH